MRESACAFELVRGACRVGQVGVEAEVVDGWKAVVRAWTDSGLLGILGLAGVEGSDFPAFRKGAWANGLPAGS
ncbi:MAG: hypothetical protein H6734_06245 [Alphaproteobacteria bacterium]|nr:hypothetical protein [Alphaproteobacteria bacterium]